MINKQFSVWPHVALALLSGVIGMVMISKNTGPVVPAETELVQVSGTIDKIFLVDDLSGSRTAIMKPMNSLHFTLKEMDREFRYPGSWPGFSKVWRQLSFHVDIWINEAAMESDEPLLVFQLEQQVPENWVVEAFSVSYSEILESQSGSTRSYVRVGTGLIALSACFMLIAMFARIWNVRHPRPEPRWFPPDS